MRSPRIPGWLAWAVEKFGPLAAAGVVAWALQAKDSWVDGRVVELTSSCPERPSPEQHLRAGCRLVALETAQAGLESRVAAHEVESMAVRNRLALEIKRRTAYQVALDRANRMTLTREQRDAIESAYTEALRKFDVEVLDCKCDPAEAAQNVLRAAGVPLR